MFNSLKGIKKPFGVIVLLFLPLFIFTSVLFGGEAERKADVNKPEGKADFILTIEEGLISLNAKDASLKEIVEEIGRRMEIEVVANIPDEEKITMEFEKLSLEDAIERLARNYVYEKKSEEGKITKIVLLPKGEGTVPSTPTTKKSGVEEGKSMVKPEIRTKEKSPQPETEEVDKEKSTRPEPFMFEFNP